MFVQNGCHDPMRGSPISRLSLALTTTSYHRIPTILRNCLVLSYPLPVLPFFYRLLYFRWLSCVSAAWTKPSSSGLFPVRLGYSQFVWAIPSSSGLFHGCTHTSTPSLFLGYIYATSILSLTLLDHLSLYLC